MQEKFKKKSRGFESWKLKTLVSVLIVCFSPQGNAQINSSHLSMIEQKNAVNDGERLHQWVLRRTPQSNDYAAGALWFKEDEKARQQELKAKLLDLLRNEQARPSLIEWIAQRPATGRVALASMDGFWLAAHPANDPVLHRTDQIVIPARPAYVSVLLENGQICQAKHQPGALAIEYLIVCAGDDGKRDMVWVAQPNGEQQRYGIAHWNAEHQTPPQPGAWIWAPSRQSGVQPATSDLLVRFLATQGIAHDRGQSAVYSQAEPLSPWTTAGLQPNVHQAPDALAHGATLTANDWGEIGLLQTPTARMDAAGTVRTHIGYAKPYTRGTVMLQPLDWLEGGFRYTDISDRLYDPSLTIARQSYKDKSMDVKIRLWPESRYIPQLAVGLRDLGGTGLFSSEYLVGSKRVGNFDWSLGLGWGYMAQRGDFSNPLGLVSAKFKNRPVGFTGSGGEVSYQSIFRGPVALFGGVQWQSPYAPIILKMELEGNNYKKEPSGQGDLKQRTPINFGVVYRHSPRTDISASYERGNRLTLGLTFKLDWSKTSVPKIFDPAPPPVFQMAAKDTSKVVAENFEKTVKDLEALTNWSIQGIESSADTWIVSLEDNGTMYRQLRREKAMAVLHRDAPAHIERFILRFKNRALFISEQSVNRKQWVDKHFSAITPSQKLKQDGEITREWESTPFKAGESNSSTSKQASHVVPQAVAETKFLSDKKFSSSVTPSFSQSFGGPDAFMLYQFSARADVKYRLTPSTWVSGGANLRLLDNYDKFKYDAPSNLPRVRTSVREYVTTSRLTIDNLQLTHVRQLSGNQFASVYGGILESMYAGVGAEWLYRPLGSRWALGIDANHVQQRGFEQKFSMRDYTISTGHATLYWDTGWNDIKTKISVGQYLAGDRGATLDVSRTFSNGVTMGAWATKTNVSAAQFGEGSFDKGIYVRFPFDMLLLRSSSTAGSFTWQPLLRDGGARLGRSVELYSMTNGRDRMAWKYQPAPSVPEPLQIGADIFGH